MEINRAFSRIQPATLWMRTSILLVLGLFCLPLFVTAGDPEAEAVLAKARKRLGSEAKLNGVQSLRFTGTITTVTGKSNTIEIVLKKPYKQRQVFVGDKLVREIGLNDYEAWTKVYNKKTPHRYNLIPHTAEALRRIRASTFENLYFFFPFSNRWRKVEYLDRNDYDGLKVHRVKVSYGKVYYLRYIEETTGQLVLTEVETGERIVEGGEIVAGGIRFPRTLTTFRKGNEVHRISFDEIQVNPVLDDSLFTLPPLPGLKQK